MRYLYLAIIPLSIFALEIIVNPYDDIQDGIEVYHYNECYCPEEDEALPQEPFDFDKFLLKL